MDALIFDVDDTLYDQLIPFKKAIEKNFPAEIMDAENLYQKSRTFSDKVFNLTESGKMTLNEMHVYRLQEAFKCFGKHISVEEALNFQQDYQKNQENITLLPDVQEVFKLCLRKNIIMGIITNGPEEHQKNKINQLGIKKWISNEHIFISSKVGIAKPDAEIFAVVQKKLNLNPMETFYFGDSIENDMVGASNAGWKTIWSNRRNKKIDTNNVKIDYSVNDQNDLLSVVQYLLN